MSLANLSRAWNELRYQLASTQQELEELRMTIHQYAACKRGSKPYIEAQRALRAVAIERHALLTGLAQARERGEVQ